MTRSRCCAIIRAKNAKLTETAREVVSGTLLPATLAKSAPRPKAGNPDTD